MDEDQPAVPAGGGDPARINVPTPSVVALVGPSGSGKSSFASRHFEPQEIFSSDAWRATLSGREADQRISSEAFAALYAAAVVRLAAGGAVLIDATNLTLDARGRALDLASGAACPAIVIAFDLPLDVCLAWNEARAGRRVPVGVVRRQHRQFRRALARLAREGFDAVHVIGWVGGLATVEVVRSAAGHARA